MKPHAQAGTLIVNGEAIGFAPGDTVASCLMRAGRLILRRSRRGEPRGVFCGIGICNDCLVSVDGSPDLRACLTEARDGLTVTTDGAAQ